MFDVTDMSPVSCSVSGCDIVHCIYLRATMTDDVLSIIRRLPGSWRLPITDDDSVTATFFPNSSFFWMIAAYSMKSKVVRMLTGDEIKGTWQVRSVRSKKTLQASSRESSAALKRLFSGADAPEVTEPPGPFLVLTFTDYMKSLLNLQVMGFRADLMNWLNHAKQLLIDNSYRIVDFNDQQMVLELDGRLDTWHRSSDSFA
jgi:hypothetical protein